jgi:hypothetical protein
MSSGLTCSFSSAVFHLDMPPLIVGYCYWDNWMIWSALRSGIPVLDGTSFVMPIHQNHGYNPAFGRAKGVATDALSLRNLELTGGTSRIEHIKSSTHRLGKRGWVYPNVFRYPLALKRVWVPRIASFVLYDLWLPVWHAFLDIARPICNVLGLRARRP